MLGNTGKLIIASPGFLQSSSENRKAVTFTLDLSVCLHLVCSDQAERRR